PGVIDVVKRGAVDDARHLAQPLSRGAGHRGAQRAVLLRQQPQIVAPELVARFVGVEPIASFPRKRAPLLTCEPAAHRVLPIGAVKGQLPGVVPAVARAPQRFLWRQPAQRAAQIRSVPRAFLIGLIEQANEIISGHINSDASIASPSAKRAGRRARTSMEVLPSPLISATSCPIAGACITP